MHAKRISTTEFENDSATKEKFITACTAIDVAFMGYLETTQDNCGKHHINAINGLLEQHASNDKILFNIILFIQAIFYVTTLSDLSLFFQFLIFFQFFVCEKVKSTAYSVFKVGHNALEQRLVVFVGNCLARNPPM